MESVWITFYVSYITLPKFGQLFFFSSNFKVFIVFSVLPHLIDIILTLSNYIQKQNEDKVHYTIDNWNHYSIGMKQLHLPY